MSTAGRHLVGWALSLAAGMACAAYPDKPITLVVPYSPGGMGSTFGNLMSEALSPALGQRVVVDYRPGANGGLGAALVAKAPADGYTLLMAVNSTMAINPAIYPKLQYDPIKDFSPVAMVYTSANVLMVNAKSPYRSVADLVSYAKANPGKLNYGSSGNGATPHLSGEMFRRMAGISINHVPYKGIGPAIVDLIGGQIELVFSDTSAMTQVTGGNLRALAVTGPSRLGMAPNLPTMQEQGFPGFSIRSWYSIAAPAGTPKAVVERLNAEIAKVVRSPEMRQRMKDIGVDPAEDTSVHYLDATTRADLAMWKKFVTEADIKLD
ncbi:MULTISPECIES: Bug family tripartite tricarboxylate transporter substrate binding protein [unclassified Variovorax]|jgi:tripartite-type tricarboxylate transporter receptor subunit TctC|uniref:Bug family tripartite tricarboxylate transporter substrate binding protein n=1 Tax=unclassified Variovorax TaxID=663243 RepID=UPI0008E93679|nr:MULTISPECIES: tripartite tricarboxylate transporter substrate binding protein [unclassified Variovorax]SFP29504.1 Tripartite-type tricarboxylate transporter, receptor component TctC [Variovorax sp. PDC80]